MLYGLAPQFVLSSKLCSVLVTVISVFNPTLSFPQASQYYTDHCVYSRDGGQYTQYLNNILISIFHVTLKITCHRDILMMLLFLFSVVIVQNDYTSVVLLALNPRKSVQIANKCFMIYPPADGLDLTMRGTLNVMFDYCPIPLGTYFKLGAQAGFLSNVEKSPYLCFWRSRLR